jgi:hypothetical protein
MSFVRRGFYDMGFYERIGSGDGAMSFLFCNYIFNK